MRFSYKIFILLFFALVGSNHVVSQITTSNAPPYDTEEYLVNDVLLGADLTTSNFMSQGFAQGIGYFDGTNANIGFEEGVILSTGGLDFVTGGFGAGSGISGEPDLELALNQINLFWDVNNGIARRSWARNKEAIQAIKTAMKKEKFLKVTIPNLVDEKLIKNL